MHSLDLHIKQNSELCLKPRFNAVAHKNSLQFETKGNKKAAFARHSSMRTVNNLSSICLKTYTVIFKSPLTESDTRVLQGLHTIQPAL